MALVSWNLLSTGGRVTCRNLLTPSNVCQGGVVCMMWGRGSLSSFTYWLNAHPLIWCHNWFFFFIHLFLFFSCHPHCMLPTVGQFIIICLFSSCETTMIHSLCCFNRMVFVPGSVMNRNICRIFVENSFVVFLHKIKPTFSHLFIWLFVYYQ